MVSSNEQPKRGAKRRGASSDTDSVGVLFVCMGNICRSPTAEGVMRALLEREGLQDRFRVESAGTHAYHVDDGADPRSVQHARLRGYDLSRHRARQVRDADLDRFDYVLAMDRDNLRHLEALVRRRGTDAPPRARVGLLLELLPAIRRDEVPDPYATGSDGFELVLDLVESACEALLEQVEAGRQK